MTLTVQFYTILSMILMGIFVGVAVDTYGRFMHPSRWSILLFLSDILFWIVQGLLIFFVLLKVNEGEIRFYIFVALLCGFAMYRALFQTFYNYFLTVLIRLIRTVIQFTLNVTRTIVVKPIQTFIRLFIQLFAFLGSMLLAFFLFVFRIIVTLLKWIGRLIWSITPEYLKNQLKRLAGFMKIMQNKIKKWFGRV